MARIPDVFCAQGSSLACYVYLAGGEKNRYPGSFYVTAPSRRLRLCFGTSTSFTLTQPRFDVIRAEAPYCLSPQHPSKPCGAQLSIKNRIRMSSLTIVALHQKNVGNETSPIGGDVATSA